MHKKSYLLVIVILISACAPATQTAPVTFTPDFSTATPVVESTLTPQPMPDALWLSPAVPNDLRDLAKTFGLPIVTVAESASTKLDVS
ncbi:MAG: hypothetical protein JNK32_10025, partial [Anaerolineales bacterium]|nr:hypothetical protein [Anaerolineales bacterium]